MYKNTFKVLCLLGASILPLHAVRAQEAPPPEYNLSPTGVNLIDGTYIYSVTDFTIGDLTLQRTYLGQQGSGARMFGPRWTSNFETSVYETSSGSRIFALLQTGNTSKQFYVTNKNPREYSGLLTEANHNWTLSYSNNVFVGKGMDQTVYTFSLQPNHPFPARSDLKGGQRLARSLAPDGKKRTYTYDSSGRLKLVVSNAGYAILFQYGSAGYPSKACGFNLAVSYVNASSSCSNAQVSTDYTYAQVSDGTSSSYMLSSYTTPRNKTGYYTYYSSHGRFIKCVRPAGYSSCKIQLTYHDTDYQGMSYSVDQQTMADGSVWHFSTTVLESLIHPEVPNTLGDPNRNRWTYTTMTDPKGNQTKVKFLGGHLSTIQKSSGLTKFDYGYPNIAPQPVTYPEGDKVTFGPYDPDGNVLGQTHAPKPGSGLSAVSSTAVIESNCSAYVYCHRARSFTDAKGNKTDYTYSNVHGHKLTVTGPAVGGVRPQTRYTYTKRYAWIKNSSGAFVKSPDGIWLLTKESSCRTSAATGNASSPCATAGDEVKVVYDYGPDSGPNNLRLRGKAVVADGETRRTCYQYDALGNRIAETSPRAGLTACL